jgi:hypothetical protein
VDRIAAAARIRGNGGLTVRAVTVAVLVLVRSGVGS